MRRLTRDDLIRLGQQNRPWEFLPLALQVASATPDDLHLRLLIAANWTRLALPTPASESLRDLPAAAADLPEVAALRKAIGLLPADRIPTTLRIQTARENIAALAERGPGLGPDFDRWAGSADQTEFFRAADGQCIRRAAATAGRPPGPWLGVADHLAAATRWDAQIAADQRAAERPLILEGVDPPWLLARLLERRGDRKDSYRPRITILQADRAEFFDGLSLTDLSRRLAGPNVIALTGPDAADQLRRDLRARLDYDITGPVLSLHGIRNRLTPGPIDLTNEIGREQQALTESLHAQVQQHYRGRGPEAWARRFREALSGAGEPLRVLIPTARNSTFIKHASADLVDAFNRLGMRAELLIEPDDCTRMAAPAYLRRFNDLRPDLVILINYPRSMMADAIPAEVPFICWLQDAMPHLFRPERGAAHGPLDFLVGHLFEELFARHGYPRARALESPVLASETKFHTAPATPGEAAKYDCEIAYVSHQSETPEAQHQRLREQFAKTSPLAPVIDHLGPVVRAAIARPAWSLATLLAPDLARAALREVLKSEPEPQAVDLVVRAYIEPHADRLIRHETLGWAADAAERRGWRFRLYGRGWEQHPRLAAHAAGELPHGDALRLSYQRAGLHLHMTMHSLVHQRLMECILSGGFPLCRLHTAEMWEITWWLAHQGVAEGARPIDAPLPPGYPDFFRTLGWADAPSLLRLASILGRWGLIEKTYPAVNGAAPGPHINWRHYEPVRPPEDYRPDRFCAFWALNEQAEMFFHDADSLERAAAEAIERPGIRAAASRAALDRIAARSTYAGLARRMAEFIRDRLEAHATPEAPATPEAGRKDAA